MKIVTLLPSATEIVCALGLQDSLVAVSHECDYPTAVTQLPAITSSIIPHDLSPAEIDSAVVDAVRAGEALYQVDGDMLAQLQPDLIITQGICDVCAVNQGTVEQSLKFLEDVITDNVQVLSLSGTTFAGVMRDMRLVAQATQTEQVAQELIDGLCQQWKQLPHNHPETKPRVLMLEWSEPFFFGGHWVPEMVEMAGGIDVIGQVGVDSGRCTFDDIQKADPDIIAFIACGYDLEKNITFAKEFLKRPNTQPLKAVQNNRIWAFDANSYFSRPAPRLLDGAILLQNIFNQNTDSLMGASHVTL